MDRGEHRSHRRRCLARSDTNPTGVSLGAGLSGSPHRYRIEWTADGFDFYVDGAPTPTASLAYPLAGPLNVGGSDLDLAGPTLIHRLGTNHAVRDLRHVHLPGA